MNLKLKDFDPRAYPVGVAVGKIVLESDPLMIPPRINLHAVLEKYARKLLEQVNLAQMGERPYHARIRIELEVPHAPIDEMRIT